MATTIHELIDQLRTASGSDAECGDRFERLMLAYLRTDPMWFSLSTPAGSDTSR